MRSLNVMFALAGGGDGSGHSSAVGWVIVGIVAAVAIGLAIFRYASRSR